MQFTYFHPSQQKFSAAVIISELIPIKTAQFELNWTA